MKTMILASAAALAMAVPAVAQDAVAVTAEGDAYVLTGPQQTMYDSWPVERQTAYTAWPNDYKVYYWTLTEPQQNGWWLLTDDQRTRVFAMTPEQRVAAWTAIEGQMASMPAAAASTTATAATTAAVTAGTAARPQFVSNTVVQTTPAGANATAKTEYPPCKGDIQDSCVNPREAGLNYGNRPLNYWPGQPASEKAATKPASM